MTLATVLLEKQATHRDGYVIFKKFDRVCTCSRWTHRERGL